MEFATSDFEILGDVGQARRYPARALVLGEGDQTPGLWLVLSGRARVFRTAPSGRDFTLSIARPGRLACFALCPLVDARTCPAHVETIEASTIYFAERERLWKAASQNREVAALVIRVLAAQYRHLSHVATGLAVHCSAPRLADLLLGYADEHGCQTERGTEFDLDVTHEMLASMMGTSVQMVTFCFQRLMREGTVEARGRHIVIPDLDRLANSS